MYLYRSNRKIGKDDNLSIAHPRDSNTCYLFLAKKSLLLMMTFFHHKQYSTSSMAQCDALPHICTNILTYTRYKVEAHHDTINTIGVCTQTCLKVAKM